MGGKDRQALSSFFFTRHRNFAIISHGQSASTARFVYRGRMTRWREYRKFGGCPPAAATAQAGAKTRATVQQRARLQPKHGAAPLPGAYLSAALEERHPGAMAFEFESTVAAFLPAAQAERETTAQLLPLLDKLGLICGVSGAFSNLYEANQAWFQASSALQNGLLQDGSCPVFYFQDYLLPQLLSGALAGRPSWVYYPDGLKKLKAHDENSQVSYLETLRVYLDNNLSVTKTAAALYLHRSTLLDRLAHITQMLGCDLKDPDFCLTLGILLRAELQQKRITQPKP